MRNENERENERENETMEEMRARMEKAAERDLERRKQRREAEAAQRFRIGCRTYSRAEMAACAAAFRKRLNASSEVDRLTLLRWGIRTAADCASEIPEAADTLAGILGCRWWSIHRDGRVTTDPCCTWPDPLTGEVWDSWEIIVDPEAEQRENGICLIAVRPETGTVTEDWGCHK